MKILEFILDHSFIILLICLLPYATWHCLLGSNLIYTRKKHEKLMTELEEKIVSERNRLDHYKLQLIYLLLDVYHKNYAVFEVEEDGVKSYKARILTFHVDLNSKWDVNDKSSMGRVILSDVKFPDKRKAEAAYRFYRNHKSLQITQQQLFDYLYLVMYAQTLKAFKDVKNEIDNKLCEVMNEFDSKSSKTTRILPK